MNEDVLHKLRGTSWHSRHMLRSQIPHDRLEAQLSIAIQAVYASSRQRDEMGWKIPVDWRVRSTAMVTFGKCEEGRR